MKIISLCRVRVVCAVRVILPEKRSGISARNNREIGADCKGIVALYSIGFSGRLVRFFVVVFFPRDGKCYWKEQSVLGFPEPEWIQKGMVVLW